MITEELINKNLKNGLALYFGLQQMGRNDLAKLVLAVTSQIAVNDLEILRKAQKEQEAFNKESNYDHAVMDN